MNRLLLRYPRRNGIILILSIIICWANSHWITPNKTSNPQTCVSCHKDIVASHLRTAHYLSSAPASSATIKGSFKNGKNRFIYNDHMEVVLEKKNNQYFQTAYFNGNLYESESFDIVIGSARKGQSYLYWDDHRLLQLPISYYTPADAWCNSPGYPTNLVYYNKQVPGQCMECHATAARVTTGDNGAVSYDKSTIILGIDCQRCHGPGTEHIAWHSAHPGDSLAGKYIINTKRLGRQQRLDACALCHSGFRKQLTPSFSFQVGDTLENYSTAVYDTAATATLDVHGNQYGLLTSSKCFIKSNMDCSSCHNVHVDEAGKRELFSQRCMSCHNGKDQHACSSPAVKKMGTVKNCIDCHMPLLPSNKILLQLNGNATLVHDLVRTHHIAIYPQPHN